MTDGGWIRLDCFENLEWVHALQKSQMKHNKVFVNVPVPAKYYDRADDILKAAYNNLFKTNIVCTAVMFRRAELAKVVQVIPGQYIRSKFPSASGDVCEPRGSWTLFPATYIRCAGSNTREAAQWIIYWLIYRMHRGLGTPFVIYNFIVQNNVSATTLPYGINLNRFQNENQLHVKYKHEMFPGAIMRMDNLVAQVFDSGKVNLVGAKNPLDPVIALEELESKLRMCAIRTFPCSATAMSAAEIYDCLVRELPSTVLITHEKQMRQKKKVEKTRKDKSKFAKQNERAMSQWLTHTVGKRTKRKRAATSSSSSSSSSSSTAAVFFDTFGSDVSMTEEEESMMTDLKKIGEFIKINDDPEQNRIFFMTLKGADRLYDVELHHDKIIHVLDADNDQQAAEVRAIIDKGLGVA
jgi:TATA-box binding protein (TBP) (component of TFIID and TFIIIB)